MSTENTTMNNAINMLPCPMCGCSSINVKNEQPTDNSGGYFIECPDCGISTSLRYACGDDPIPLLTEQWNRRATAQCLHQIAEPAAPHAARDLGIAALEQYLKECEENQIVADVGGAFAYAWQRAAAQQAVQPVVPLPLLVRDIARDLGITVPEACIALKPLGNYSTNSAVTAEMARMLRDHFPARARAAEPMFWVRLCRDGLYEGPVHNNSASGKLQRDAKPEEWHPLYLHTAPAHPAEGVPAQCPNINEPRGCWRVACQLGGKCREPERAATQPAAQGLKAPTQAARSVLAERARQIAAEGWTPEKDDAYNPGVLAEAGGIYALHAFDPRRAKEVPEGWPWSPGWWKPKDPRSNLVKAGALILAEIERIDRTYAAQAKQGGAV